MKSIILLVALLFTVSIPSQQPANSGGKWDNVTKDREGTIFFGGSGGKLLIVEDYEVVQTHEVCATVYGYFLEKSAQGRYDVNFKGMRTTATFTFTTQWDAEHWVQKFCTPQSLLQIKAGRSTFARSY